MMGSPLRGPGLLVLVRNEGLVSPFGSGTLVSSWLAIPPLSAGMCAPCHSECVACWSSCVLTVGLPLALSRVLHGPLFEVWGGLSYPTLFSAGWGGASVGCSALRPAAACALSPGVPLSPLCTPGRRSASRFS